MKMKDMCELIAKAEILVFRLENDRPATAKEISNYSPTGELSRISEWFIDATKQLYMENRLDNKDRKLIREFFKEVK